MWAEVYDELAEQKPIPIHHVHEYSGDDVGCSRLTAGGVTFESSSAEGETHREELREEQLREEQLRKEQLPKEPLRVNIHSMKYDSSPQTDDWFPGSPEGGIGTVTSSSNESAAVTGWTQTPASPRDDESDGDLPAMYEPAVVDLPDSAEELPKATYSSHRDIDSNYHASSHSRSEEDTFSAPPDNDGVPSTLPPKVGLPTESCSSAMASSAYVESYVREGSENDVVQAELPRLNMSNCRPPPDLDHVRTPHESSLSAISSSNRNYRGIPEDSLSGSWQHPQMSLPLVSTVISAGPSYDLNSVPSPNSTNQPAYTPHSIGSITRTGYPQSIGSSSMPQVLSEHQYHALPPIGSGSQSSLHQQSLQHSIGSIHHRLSPHESTPGGSLQDSLRQSLGSTHHSSSMNRSSLASAMRPFTTSPLAHMSSSLRYPVEQTLPNGSPAVNSLLVDNIRDDNVHLEHPSEQECTVSSAVWESREAPDSTHSSNRWNAQMEPTHSPTSSHSRKDLYGSLATVQEPDPYVPQVSSDEVTDESEYAEKPTTYVPPPAVFDNIVVDHLERSMSSKNSSDNVSDQFSRHPADEYQRADQSPESDGEYNGPSSIDTSPVQPSIKYEQHYSSASSSTPKVASRKSSSPEAFRFTRADESDAAHQSEHFTSHHSDSPHYDTEPVEWQSPSPPYTPQQFDMSPPEMVSHRSYQTSRLPHIPETPEERGGSRRKFLTNWAGDNRVGFYGHWTYNNDEKDVKLQVSVARRARKPDELLFVARVAGLGARDRGRAQNFLLRKSSSHDEGDGWTHDAVDEDVSERDWEIVQDEARYQETRNLTGPPSADTEPRELFHHGNGTIMFYRAWFRGRWTDMARPHLLLELISRIFGVEMPDEIEIDSRVKIASSRQSSMNMNVLLMFCGDRNNEIRKRHPRRSVISSGIGLEASHFFMDTEGCQTLPEFLCATLTIPGSCCLESEADPQASIGLAGLFRMIKTVEPTAVSPTTRALAPGSPGPGAEADELDRVPNIYAALATRYFYWKPAGRALGFFVLLNFYSGKILLFEPVDDSAFGTCDAFAHLLAYLRFPPSSFLIPDASYHRFIRLKAEKPIPEESWTQLETLFQHWLYGHKCSPWQSSLALPGPSQYVLDLQTIDYGSPYGPDEVLTDHFVALQCIMGLRTTTHVQIPVATSASIRIWSPTRGEEKPSSRTMFTIFRAAFWFLQDLHYCTANGDRMKANMRMNNTLSRRKSRGFDTSDDEGVDSNVGRAFWGARRDLQPVRAAQIAADRLNVPRHEKEPIKNLLRALKAESEKASQLAIKNRGLLHTRSKSRRSTMRNASPAKMLQTNFSGPVLSFASHSAVDPVVSSITLSGGMSVVPRGGVTVVESPSVRVHKPVRQIHVPKEVWSSPEWHFPGLRNRLRADLEKKQQTAVTSGMVSAWLYPSAPDLLIRPTTYF